MQSTANQSSSNSHWQEFRAREGETGETERNVGVLEIKTDVKEVAHSSPPPPPHTLNAVGASSDRVANARMPRYLKRVRKWRENGSRSANESSTPRDG